MGHVVLLGDSIFDNERYVPGGPSVIEHLRRFLPAGWQATLRAADGSITEDVALQLPRLPPDATHLVVSAGGNDALEQGAVLWHEPPGSFLEIMARLAELREDFRREYRRMLHDVLSQGRPTIACTVYDAIPGLDRGEQTGLALFNEIILREAFRAGVPVIDLRLLCTERSDYAESSPIEPSVDGGRKIARAIGRVVREHDFETRDTRTYC